VADNTYRLLVVDVDGTLVGKDGIISAEDRRALAQVRDLGIPVSLSTGRALRACSGVFRQLELDGYHIFFDGALVSDPHHTREVYVQSISPAVVKRTVDFAHLNDVSLELFSATRYFVERESWFSDIRRRFFDVEPTIVDFTNLWEQEKVVKEGLLVDSPQEAEKAQRFYLAFKDSLGFSRAKTPAYPDVDFINIVAPEVSKGKALELLASYLGVPLSQVMAVGDGSNDIPLLSMAGLAIAMGHASAEVKAVADYVTLDVDHSGVAAAINQFLL